MTRYNDEQDLNFQTKPYILHKMANFRFLKNNYYCLTPMRPSQAPIGKVTLTCPICRARQFR